jgi:hypothetical protein
VLWSVSAAGFTVDRAAEQTITRQRVTGARHAGCYGPPKLTGEKEGNNAKPSRGSQEHERRYGGEEKRRWLELDTSAEDSGRELRNEGKRCGGVRGCPGVELTLF